MRIASVPSGHGYELVAVALYDDEGENHAFEWNAFQAACQIINVSRQEVRKDEGSFRNRRVLFHPELVEALENLANGRADFFDVITLTSGRWTGLQAAVVGSTTRKRARAARLAFAIAAVHDARHPSWATLNMCNIECIGHCIQRPWVPWKPELHKHWDLLSRRTVDLLLLCQHRQAHTGLGAIQQLLISHVLPFMMPGRFEIW